MKQNLDFLNDFFHKQVSEVQDYVCAIYHELHAHPEISFHEKETASRICRELTAMGVPFRKDIGGDGILARVTFGNASAHCFALRADMDALPIQEETGLPFASQTPGLMHACGHDSHMASLLGIIRGLLSVRNHFPERLNGTVLFIFQPGEEQDPGGASLMLDDGVFDRLQPEFIVGQHSSPDHRVGDVVFGEGQVMSSADELHLTVTGKGGHGARPHLVNDTVLCAAQIIVSLQQVVSRLSNPFSPTVVSFGRFIADGYTNIIPDEVHLSGTLRTTDEQWRKQARETVLRIAQKTAEAYGCSCTMKKMNGYPAVFNNPDVTRRMRGFAEEYLGVAHVGEMARKMTSEDFGFFSQAYPSTFFRFGVLGNANPTCGGQHTATFLIDEEAFLTSVGAMGWMALRSLME